MSCCGFGPVKEPKNQKRQCKRCGWFVGIVYEVRDGVKVARDSCSNPSCLSHHKGAKK